jgi:hypothetical protein
VGKAARCSRLQPLLSPAPLSILRAPSSNSTRSTSGSKGPAASALNAMSFPDSAGSADRLELSQAYEVVPSHSSEGSRCKSWRQRPTDKGSASAAHRVVTATPA